MALISAVTEAAFAARRQGDWNALDALVRKVGRTGRAGLKGLHPFDVARIPVLYRDVCADLARAQAARYSAPLVEYLQGLTAAAHTVVYGPHARAHVAKSHLGIAPAARRMPTLRAALEAFPRAVRRHKRPVFLAMALFFVPFAFGLLATLSDPHFAFRIVPEPMLRSLTEAYAKGFADGRDTATDAAMAGFYVNNNVGIALRCFALGIFGGVGAAFYLVENGLSIGALLGYVSARGAGQNIVTFVVGHGSLELGAIVLAGAAGMAMGWSVIAPGERTRLASLQAVSRDVITIVFGAAVMLFMAAGIEAFWSSSSVPSLVKRGIGAALFVIVVGYLTLVGRRGRRAGDEPEAGAP